MHPRCACHVNPVTGLETVVASSSLPVNHGAICNRYIGDRCSFLSEKVRAAFSFSEIFADNSILLSVQPVYSVLYNISSLT
jgi:hypothetical protein